jgi:hypothetical protein
VRLLTLVAAVVLATGCGGDDDQTAAPPATTATPPAAESRCTAATTDLMTPLANKVTLEDARLINGQVVKSEDHDDVYFVAAEIDSLRLPNSGDVAVWATTSPHGAEAIFSVNELAKQSSDWRDAEAIDVSPDDDGAAEARACVFR